MIAAQEYGYLGVALAVSLESMGVPIPGETELNSLGLPVRGRCFWANLTALTIGRSPAEPRRGMTSSVKSGRLIRSAMRRLRCRNSGPWVTNG
jgi:hypothetical protein